MSTPSPVHRVVIDIEPGSDPISGTLAAPAGPARRFCGWLELISELDAEFQPDADPRGATWEPKT